MISQSITQSACSMSALPTQNLRDSVVRLSAGDLSHDERQALVEQILKNPAAAREAKLALRLGDQATQTASLIVQRADMLSAKTGFTWSLRTLAAGACAGMLMFFTLGGQQNDGSERAVVSISSAPDVSDQIMSSSGFEAPDADFGGSFE